MASPRTAHPLLTGAGDALRCLSKKSTRDDAIDRRLIICFSVLACFLLNPIQARTATNGITPAHVNPIASGSQLHPPLHVLEALPT
jgi:hypothetical protein